MEIFAVCKIFFNKLEIISIFCIHLHYSVCLLLRDLTAILLISACITCFYNSLVVQAFIITYILILLLKA